MPFCFTAASSVRRINKILILIAHFYSLAFGEMFASRDATNRGYRGVYDDTLSADFVAGSLRVAAVLSYRRDCNPPRLCTLVRMVAGRSSRPAFHSVAVVYAEGGVVSASNA